MSREDHPKGTTLAAKPREKPCSFLVTRQWAAPCERNTRLLESRERVRNRKRGGK